MRTPAAHSKHIGKPRAARAGCIFPGPFVQKGSQPDTSRKIKCVREKAKARYDQNGAFLLQMPLTVPHAGSHDYAVSVRLKPQLL